MTIKQKIKTWHIVVLIILGIGGYWLSQNMWVFEKSIPVEKYNENIIGKWKPINERGEKSYFEEYSTEKIFSEKYINGKNEEVIIEERAWVIKNKTLYTELTFENLSPERSSESSWVGAKFNYEIYFLSKNYLRIKYIGPLAPEYSIIETYKKIKD